MNSASDLYASERKECRINVVLFTVYVIFGCPVPLLLFGVSIYLSTNNAIMSPSYCVLM